MARRAESATPAWGAWLTLPGAEDGGHEIGGLYGGSLGLVAATRIAPGRRTLLLHPSSLEVEDLAGDVELFGVGRERILVYPEENEDESGMRRRATLTRLHGRHSPVLLASAEAARQPAPDPAGFCRAAARLRPGEAAPGPEAWVRRLAAAGWARVSLVLDEGEFSARGDVLDLYPPGFDAPLRLEYFGDELEAIREFDPSTQRTRRSLPETAFPLLEKGAGGRRCSTTSPRTIPCSWSTPSAWKGSRPRPATGPARR
ncbi:MAG: hypothetical protein ACE5JG_05770 [Planctomycetota bacterium]